MLKKLSRQQRLVVLGFISIIYGVIIVLFSSFLSNWLFLKSSTNDIIFQGLLPALGYTMMVAGFIVIIASALRTYPFQPTPTKPIEELLTPTEQTVRSSSTEQSVQPAQPALTEQSVQNAPAEPLTKSARAWDLAQKKLEDYFNRNLSQISFIFWLSVAVMVVGFGFIVFGLAQVITSSQSATKVSNNIPGGSLTPAVIAGIAGTITEFIGATFLFIYRSTIQQASNYMEMLERINRVGMAMDILESMTASSDPTGLQDKTKAEVVKLLFSASSSSFRASQEPSRTSLLRRARVSKSSRNSGNSTG